MTPDWANVKAQEIVETSLILSDFYPGLNYAIATALREAEARGLERAVSAIENHPLQFNSDMTLTRYVVAAIAEQCIAAIRAEKERKG